MKMRVFGTGASLLASLAALACGGAGPESSATTLPRPLTERLAAIDHDVGPGSSGDDVRAVHDYLIAYGYLPNAILQQKFPAWRPMVTRSPAVEDVFDDKSVEAVQIFQTKMGLNATGVVDSATRAVMAQPRCGVPDGIQPVDPSSKFSVGDTHLSTSNIYSFGSWTNQLTTTQVADAAYAASRSWEATTAVYLEPYTGWSSPNVFIDFQSGSANPELGTHLAITHAYNGSATILINTDYQWSVASTTPWPKFDFQSMLVHEMGHALGLGHSSMPPDQTGHPPVMHTPLAATDQNRNPGVDDHVAANTKYAHWSAPLGGFIAEDVGADLTFGDVWIIQASDHSMWKWVGGSNFTRDSANGDARRIAVDPQGLPWVAAPWGVYRRTTSNPATGTWQQMRPDCTTDIGVGHETGVVNEAVWIVGCDARVYKWLGGTTWAIDNAVGATASRISVDNIGTPWIISSGVPFHRSSNDPNSGFYASLGGLATDIGAGAFPYAWRTTQTPTTGGYTLEAFDYQDAAPNTSAEWKWVPLYQGAVNVAVAWGGDPWIARSGGSPNVSNTYR